MHYIAALVIIVPLAAFALYFWGGVYFFDKAGNRNRTRDVIALLAYMNVGAFAVVMTSLMSYYLFGPAFHAVSGQ